MKIDEQIANIKTNEYFTKTKAPADLIKKYEAIFL